MIALCERKVRHRADFSAASDGCSLSISRVLPNPGVPPKTAWSGGLTQAITRRGMHSPHGFHHELWLIDVDQVTTLLATTISLFVDRRASRS